MSEKFIEWSEEITNGLRNGIVRVVYIKKNGDKREINATLNLGRVPSELHPKGVKDYDHTDIIRVFDTDPEVNNWRTINKTTVVEWSIVE